MGTMERNSPKPEKLSRRQFLTGLVGSGAVIATGAYLHHQYTNIDTKLEEKIDTDETLPESEIETPEKREVFSESPIYDSVLSARQIEAGEMRRDQVLFVDSFGRPLAEPVTLTPAAGYTPEEMVWRYKGEKPVGISPAWSRVQREILSHELGIPADEIFIRHVYLDLQKSKDEHMNSRIEAVYRNAQAEVEINGGAVKVVDFLRTGLDLTGLDPFVAEELRPFIVGVAAEESRFETGKTSAAGAVGMLQTMPDTVHGYMKAHKTESLDPNNVVEQIKVASFHIEQTYNHLIVKLKDELEELTTTYFSDDVMLMQKYFLIPLIINSYNAGQGKMTEVVKKFLEHYPNQEVVMEVLGVDTPLVGYDLFFAMSHLTAKNKSVSRYRADASTYVEKVIGWTRAFEAFESQPVITQ